LSVGGIALPGKAVKNITEAGITRMQIELEEENLALIKKRSRNKIK